MDLMTTQEMVYSILKDVPPARDDDDVLYAELVKRVNPVAGRLTFNEVILNRKYYGIPNFETVRRARQKLQMKKKDIRCSDKASEARFRRWKEFREYAFEEE